MLQSIASHSRDSPERFLQVPLLSAHWIRDLCPLASADICMKLELLGPQLKTSIQLSRVL